MSRLASAFAVPVTLLLPAVKAVPAPGQASEAARTGWPGVGPVMRHAPQGVPSSGCERQWPAAASRRRLRAAPRDGARGQKTAVRQPAGAIASQAKIMTGYVVLRVGVVLGVQATSAQPRELGGAIFAAGKPARQRRRGPGTCPGRPAWHPGRQWAAPGPSVRWLLLTRL